MTQKKKITNHLNKHIKILTETTFIPDQIPLETRNRSERRQLDSEHLCEKLTDLMGKD
jgi:hypothetical protein